MTNKLQLNQTVRNLGILAKVCGFHEITGDPILRPLWNDEKPIYREAQENRANNRHQYFNITRRAKEYNLIFERRDVYEPFLAMGKK